MLRVRGGEPVARGGRGAVVVSMVLFGRPGAALRARPGRREEAVEAYRYAVVALLTGATVLLNVAAVTARPPE